MRLRSERPTDLMPGCRECGTGRTHGGNGEWGPAIANSTPTVTHTSRVRLCVVSGRQAASPQYGLHLWWLLDSA
jgi:hypothetical protein